MTDDVDMLPGITEETDEQTKAAVLRDVHIEPTMIIAAEPQICARNGAKLELKPNTSSIRPSTGGNGHIDNQISRTSQRYWWTLYCHVPVTIRDPPRQVAVAVVAAGQ